MQENIKWYKIGTHQENNQKIIEEKIAQTGALKTNDDFFLEDQKTEEIIKGSENEGRKEYEDAEIFENANIMYDIASKKYEQLNDYEEKLLHDYYKLDKQFDNLETLSNKVKILSSSLEFDTSRFNLFKGDMFTAQEMESFRKEVEEFKKVLHLASETYNRDLNKYEMLNQTYSILLKRYQDLHATWYPKNPDLN